MNVGGIMHINYFCFGTVIKFKYFYESHHLAAKELFFGFKTGPNSQKNYASDKSFFGIHETQYTMRSILFKKVQMFGAKILNFF